MQFKSISPRFVALAAVAAIGLSMSNASFAGRVVTKPTGDVTKAGGSCTVTAGANSGKTGTYENDGGSLYCSGSWGSTGCVTQTGTSQCKDAAMTGGTLGKLPILRDSISSFSFVR
jgi:hypothetical protein